MSMREALLPYVTGSFSNQVILSLQRLAGVRTAKDKNEISYLFFRLTSALGEEIFAGIPLLFWLAFPDVALKFNSHFFLLVLGQLMKDIMKLPRPSHKTIVKLETHFETEFGLPSTHTMSGLMPFALLLSLQRQPPPHNFGIKSFTDGFEFNDTAIYLALLLALAGLVGVSRLYMGVHSVLDVCAGYSLGLIGILLQQLPLSDEIDKFVYRSNGGIYVSLALLIWFSNGYPKTKPWSASYATAAQIFGTWWGVAASSWLIFNFKPCLWMREALVTSSTSPLNLSKLAVGITAVGAAKVVGKVVANRVALTLLEMGVIAPVPGEERDTANKLVPKNKLYCVEVPVRVINYALLSFSVIIITPALWAGLSLL